MKKILITGITGFAGSFLAEHLLSLGDHEIHGTYLTDDSLRLLEHNKDRVHTHKVNLMEDQTVGSLISQIAPDQIYHLAALTSPGDSFKNPSENISNNITAEINVLESVRKNNLKTRIFITSSSEVYGLVEKNPIAEESPLRPVNPYAVSKIAQDYLGLQYHLAHGMEIIRVRPFVHIGPRQSPAFVVASFAKKIAEIEKKKREMILTVGNLKAKREFTDVRDMVRAYSLLMEKGESGEVYNVGSGVTHSVKEVVDGLLNLANVKIEVKVDEKLLRPMDIPELRCDNTKFVSLTGWKPEIPFETTLKDTLTYWREQIS